MHHGLRKTLRNHMVDSELSLSASVMHAACHLIRMAGDGGNKTPHQRVVPRAVDVGREVPGACDVLGRHVQDRPALQRAVAHQ
jgi:hypothetical protein